MGKLAQERMQLRRIVCSPDADVGAAPGNPPDPRDVSRLNEASPVFSLRRGASRDCLPIFIGHGHDFHFDEEFHAAQLS